MYFENSKLTRTSSIGMTVRLESKKSSLSCTTLDIVSAAIASGIAWRASSPVVWLYTFSTPGSDRAVRSDPMCLRISHGGNVAIDALFEYECVLKC